MSIMDEFHRKKESKIWSSGTGDQVYLAIRLAMALSFGEQMETLPIVLDDILSVLMKNGRKKHFASSWSWEKNNRYFFLPVMNGR